MELFYVKWLGSHFQPFAGCTQVRSHTQTLYTRTDTQTRTKNSALDEVVYTQVKCNVINTMRDEQAQGMTRHLLQCCNQLRQLNLRSNIRCSSTLVSVTNLSHLVTCSVRCNTG